MKGEPGENGGDAEPSSETILRVYTEWGTVTCNDEDDVIIYTGRAGASYHNNAGGGSNVVCLHPQYTTDSYTDDHRSSTFGTVVGVEYESAVNAPLSDLNSNNVPCTVCGVLSNAVYMQPGKTTCETGWSPKYVGYIMSEWEETISGRTSENYRSEFVCISEAAVGITGLSFPSDEATLTHVHVDCPGTNILNCGTYNQGPLTCVVCSKD